MVPFMSLGFYQGPVALWLGGADIAFVVGLVVWATTYCIMARRLDHASEARAVEASERLLEGNQP